MITYRSSAKFTVQFTSQYTITYELKRNQPSALSKNLADGTLPGSPKLTSAAVKGLM